jgi:hypothetical protein
MRLALAAPVALALALAPGVARAELPRVSVRLDYQLGPGGETCPADPSTLRALVGARLGYDPFERHDAPERLVVVVSPADKGRAWSAHVERYSATGARTVNETWPDPPLAGDCAAFASPLAAYLRGLLLSSGPPPLPVAPPKPEAPAPSPPPAPAAPPPDVPNPARTLASRVAIVSYVAAGAFLGLAVGWTVDEQNKKDAAQALSAQPNPSGGNTTCYPGAPAGSYCGRLLSAWQSNDAAVGLRNAWFAAAGVSAAVGVVATAWAVNLPTTIKGPAQAKVMLRPSGLAISGTF